MTFKTSFKIKSIQVLIMGIFFITAGYFILGGEFACGVLAGLPIGLINLYLMEGAPIKTSGKFSAHNILLARALVRMLISLAVLLISVRWGVFFMVGVAVGLMLQLVTYFKDAIKILTGKG